MTNIQLDDLTARIARLEAESRRWKVIAGAMLVVPFLLIGAGATSHGDAPGSLQAREFVLIDANGRALMRLGRDAEAKARAVLEFFDADGERRIMVGVQNNGAPYVSLTSAPGGDELRLDVQPREGSAIAFRNARSRSGLLLAAGPPGVAAVGFMDGEGRQRVEIGVNPDGSGRLTLKSADGMKQFEVP